MHVATWNVNSLTVRLPHVLAWLESNPVDVLCLQELKQTEDQFPLEAFKAIGYAHCAVLGQKTYNGVAIVSRFPLDHVEKNIPDFPDAQARLVAATVESPLGSLRLVNGYFVNGQAPGSEKFDYKMRWLQALQAYVAHALTQHAQLVLLGDFNIAPQDLDSYDPVGLAQTIHHTTEERDKFFQLIELGLVDSFRLGNSVANQYTWWDYRMLGYAKNRGLRIDHILVSRALVPRVKACTIDRTPRKWEKPSDHAPVFLELI